jgi:hypothetical protein
MLHGSWEITRVMFNSGYAYIGYVTIDWDVNFDDLTAVTMMSVVFWVGTPCSLVNWTFERNLFL